MKLKVPNLKTFVKECKEKKIDDVRVATLYENLNGRAGNHTIPMKSSKTLTTAVLNSDTVLMYEQSNGHVYNLPDELKELSEKSKKSEASLAEELKENGFSAKEGMFEL